MDLQVQNLTAKGLATRRRIIEGAAAEIRERGVAVTTLDDVRARTQTSKSQVFHYFPGGKEQLLLAVAQHEAELVLSDQQPYLGALTSWAAWQRWRDVVVDRYRRQGQQCPLAVLMSEIGRTTTGSQAVTTALMRQWHAEIARGSGTCSDRGALLLALMWIGRQQRCWAAWAASASSLDGDLGYLEAALDIGIDTLRRG